MSPSRSSPRREYGAARHRRDGWWATAFLAPSLAVFALFVFYPLARTFDMSMHRTDPFGRPGRFVGLEQLRTSLTAAGFRHSLWLSLFLVLLTVPTGMTCGLVLALLANRPMRGIRVFRTIFASTIASTAAVTSVIFLTILGPSSGLLRWVLTSLGVLDAGAHVDVLNDPRWALPVVALTVVWGSLGATFILTLAGLQAIPQEVLEAASLDGAGRMRRLLSVTLPLLSPTLLFVAVLGVIDGFLSFGQIELLTQGGPRGHTDVLAYHLYRTGFVTLDQGQAAADSIALLLVVGILVAFQLFVLRRRVHYAT